MNQEIRHFQPHPVDFRFRMQTQTSTSEGVLLDYIRNGYHPSFSAKEMVVRALKAYWLPFAYRDHQDVLVIPAMQKRLAREAISSLKQQIRDLEQSFELVSETSEPIGLATTGIPVYFHSGQPSFHNLSCGGVEQVSEIPQPQSVNEANGKGDKQWIDEDLFDSSDLKHI